MVAHFFCPDESYRASCYLYLTYWRTLSTGLWAIVLLSLCHAKQQSDCPEKFQSSSFPFQPSVYSECIDEVKHSEILALELTAAEWQYPSHRSLLMKAQLTTAAAAIQVPWLYGCSSFEGTLGGGLKVLKTSGSVIKTKKAE